MYANFTEETCTGTGDTLELAGITTGNIPFSESYADGDLVAYVLEDSGGVIKVAGVGAYVSATDDITRSDTWNWNGTVIDDNPSSNITLSGDTHTVRCDSIDDDFRDGGIATGRIYQSIGMNEVGSAVALSSTDSVYYSSLILRYSGFFDAFAFEVTATGTNVRLGLYETFNGAPSKLIAVHDTSFSVGTTGLKEASFDGGSIPIRKGNYFIAMTNDDGVSVRASQSDSVLPNQIGTTVMNSPIGTIRKVTAYAPLPDPADISSASYINQILSFGLVAT